MDQVYNAVSVVELAIEKGAETILMPVSSRRQLTDLSDEMATKINVLYYMEPKEALVKGLLE